ncbi:hypothetical protein NDU88_003738 [Pleurodeles waltl]|uniref:Uncharacterized protein n=1 Tax=Pleurodeles waltl TaxID=8319 RepID=A0AAV7NIZ4_PLEWA|nr:hypothetical protein NDU88_003738 [Pleurodeles waltl]
MREGPCDGPLLQQADLSCRTATDTASSDPEELAASYNPLPLLGNGGQEQGMHACRVHKKQNPTWTVGVGATGREKEMRDITGGEHGKEGFAETGWCSEDLPQESKAWEAPSTSSGHA